MYAYLALSWTLARAQDPAVPPSSPLDVHQSEVGTVSAPILPADVPHPDALVTCKARVTVDGFGLPTEVVVQGCDEPYARGTRVALLAARWAPHVAGDVAVPYRFWTRLDWAPPVPHVPADAVDREYGTLPKASKAARAHLTETVECTARGTTDATGITVAAVVDESCPEALATTLTEAMLTWRLVPYGVDGVPVPVTYDWVEKFYPVSTDEEKDPDDPVARRRVWPDYPRAEKWRNADVQCVVLMYLDEGGFVVDWKFEMCPLGFRDATTEAIRRWRFRPGFEDGVAVKSEYRLKVMYRLHP